jgi:hypothetical protein
MTLKWGYAWYGGQRDTDLIAQSTFTTLDADGDGYDEWAVFSIAGVDADLDVCEVRAYFKDFSVADAANTRTDPNTTGADNPAWEVRPIFASLVGTTLTVRINRWHLFRPQLQEEFDAVAIDADAAASYVDELDFYREFNDPEQQTQFLWGDEGCSTAACAESIQAGCFAVRDPKNSIITPGPGTWDADDEAFTAATWTESREPDSVRFWYRSGYQPERMPTCQPLSDYWANLIAILATARLELPLCTCSMVEQKVARWREDLTMVDDAGSHQLGIDALECPLGYRRGEVHVWRHLSKRPGLTKGRAVRL